jgi:hypothetical protein
MSFSHLNRNTKAIAAIAIFAALYAALRIIPTVPMIGTGATFHLSDILAPLYGILLGPFVGGVSIIIGTFAAIGLGSSAPFLGLDFLPAFIVAISLGFLVRGKWLPVVILNAVLLVGYAINPLTVNFIVTPWGTVPYLWMHIAAFIVLLSPLGRKAGEWIKTDTATKREKSTTKFVAILAGGVAALAIGAVLLIFGLISSGAFSLPVAVIGGLSMICGSALLIFKAKMTKLTAGFAILAFIGTMMQHLMGGILYEGVLGQLTGAIKPEAFAATWNIVFYIYPWERLALIIGAVLVGVPVTRALKKFLFTTETKPAPKTNPNQAVPK